MAVPPLESPSEADLTDSEGDSALASTESSHSGDEHSLPATTEDIPSDQSEEDASHLTPTKANLKHPVKDAVPKAKSTKSTKGKGRAGEKSRYQIAAAPVDLLAGFSAQALSEIVVGRYRCPSNQHWPKKGPTSHKYKYDKDWAKGTTSCSKAWFRDGPLLLFLSKRMAGWMPVNAADPIIFNNIASVMQKFVLDHLDA